MSANMAWAPMPGVAGDPWNRLAALPGFVRRRICGLLAVAMKARDGDAVAGATAETDQALVALALNGDSRAFERLVRRHYEMIHRVAWRQCGSAQDADDIAQTVLMQLVERLASWRGDAKLSTWLVGITINACRDHYRRQSSFRRMRDAFTAFSGLGGEPAETDALRRSWVASALSRLPADLRATLVLVAGEGLSHAEAARQLGISENTVSWRMSQIRKRLGEELGDQPEVRRGR